MNPTDQFEAERPRLERIATKVLTDPTEAEDVVQQAWPRLNGTQTSIDNVPAWLTTVTVRLCLDRLRLRQPELQADVDHTGTSSDPADEVELADTVGVASASSSPPLRPCSTPPRRRLASWPRVPAPRSGNQPLRTNWPTGRSSTPFSPQPEKATLFNGGAAAALPVFIEDRAGAAWFHRGEARVAFDFTVVDGAVRRIDFRADPDLLAQLRRRQGQNQIHPDPSRSTMIEREEQMKTMTCQQLGGPCDLALRGETADDVIKAQDRHLKDAVQGGDASHEDAHRQMKGRWKHPKKSLGWYNATKKAFAELPEDQ